MRHVVKVGPIVFGNWGIRLEPIRNELGQLVRGSPGIPGSGRKPGARKRLGEKFSKAMLADFKDGGEHAIRRFREEDPGGYVRAIVAMMPKELELEVDGLKILTFDFCGYNDEHDIDGEHVIIPDSNPVHDREPQGLLHSVPGEAEVHELHPRPIPAYASYDASGELLGIFHDEIYQPAPLSETPQLRSSSGQPAPIIKRRQRIRATTDQRSVEDPLNSSAEAAPGAAAGAFDLENYLDGI